MAFHRGAGGKHRWSGWDFLQARDSAWESCQIVQGVLLCKSGVVNVMLCPEDTVHGLPLVTRAVSQLQPQALLCRTLLLHVHNNWPAGSRALEGYGFRSNGPELPGSGASHVCRAARSIFQLRACPYIFMLSVCSVRSASPRSLLTVGRPGAAACACEMIFIFESGFSSGRTGEK